jgi:hypothetical protein
MTAATDLSNAIRLALSQDGHFICRANVGKFKMADGRWFDTGLPKGFSDLFGNRAGDAVAFYIEVKAGPCDVGDIARQLALYQSHAPPHLTPVYLVATCWPMSAADKSTLLAKGVHHIRLGEPFEAYVKARESEQVEDGAGW